ncbi:MAG: DUF4870 domain-containing protein [Prochlorothrix sp.]|nr:DUF4870 domain-containing protein [Prochlorothrix sp.]
MSYDPDQRKLLSVVSHGSVIFTTTLIFGLGIPLAILLISDDPVVKSNAKEAMNFQLNVWAWSIVIGILTFLTLGLLGFILIPLGFLIHWGMSIWAILFVLGNVNQPVRYPFILRPL